MHDVSDWYFRASQEHNEVSKAVIVISTSQIEKLRYTLIKCGVAGGENEKS